MSFASIICIFFFLPVCLIIYYLADKQYRNSVLLAASLVFCAWGAPRFIFQLLAVATAVHWLVKGMAKAEGKKRTLWLWLSLLAGSGLFLFVKYANFFILGLNKVLHRQAAAPVTWMEIVIPVGLSWFTFSAISYIVDVYRRSCPPAPNYWELLLYFFFFPKFLAGPVTPFRDFAGQVQAANDTPDNRLAGLYRFCIGLAKKVFIATVMGRAAAAIFVLTPAQLTTETAWLGALSYAFELYFDFSGYTDMAIGIALMLGLRLPENFDSPYAAPSLTEFWRRWHMSLMNWVKEYVYSPLVGNANSNLRIYASLAVAGVAAGIWHGTTKGLVVWMAYNMLFLLAERLFLGRLLAKLGRITFVYTFLVVVVGWIFFRAQYVKAAVAYVGRMFTWQPVNELWRGDTEFYFMLIAAFVFSFFSVVGVGRRLQDKLFATELPMKRHYVLAAVMVILFFLSVGRIASTGVGEFIYSKF